jgi:hypothetical protein
VDRGLAFRAGPMELRPARCVSPNRSAIFTLPVRAVLRGLRLLQVAVHRIFV